MTTPKNTRYLSYDIVIVGAGPIGLSMAQALKGAGLKIALVERQPKEKIANPAFDGREIAITHRTRAIMQDLHQWQRLPSDGVHYLKRAEVYNGNSSFALGFEKPKYVHGRAVETLGFLIANHHIRQAAYDTIKDELNDNTDRLDGTHQDSHKIDVFFDSCIVDVQMSETCAAVSLEDGSVLRSKLLIAADSRMSFIRKALGISADMHDFGRTVMVFRTTHTQSNRETAHEGFYYGKTLAVLPLGEYQSSMVITIDNTKVEEIKSLSPQQLAGEMTSWLGGRLGEMTVVSDIYDYPLLGVHARTFYTKRAALIGDAAVGMHPVTAHGYNLGMESVQILSNLIVKAAQQGKDIANDGLLRHYSHTHSLKTRAMYHGTNTIVKLYTAETPPARLLRHAALRFSEQFIPIKKIITNQLTG